MCRVASPTWCGGWITRTGAGASLVVVLELQSGVDRSMAVRVLRYASMAYEASMRRGETDADGEVRVLPVVVYSGPVAVDGPGGGARGGGDGGRRGVDTAAARVSFDRRTASGAGAAAAAQPGLDAVRAGDGGGAGGCGGADGCVAGVAAGVGSAGRRGAGGVRPVAVGDAAAAVSGCGRGGGGGGAEARGGGGAGRVGRCLRSV